MSVQTGDKLVTVDEVKAAYDSTMQYQNLTVTADSEKIENATARQIGKIVAGEFTIKASKLNAGYNSISFAISGIGWSSFPVVSVLTNDTNDDGKNFYIRITTASGIQIRASASNASPLLCMFIGCAV